MSVSVKIIRLCFCALFIIVPLIVTPWTSELFEFPKMLTVYFLTAAVACAWARQMIKEKRFIFRRTPLDFPLILFLASNLISLSLSIDRSTSLFGYYGRFNGGLLSLLCYAVLYWAFVTFMDRQSILRTLSLALSTAAIVAAWGVAEHFGADKAWWVQDVQNRVFSTLGQPNWLAAYLVALIFIPVSNAVTNNQIPISRQSPKPQNPISNWLLADWKLFVSWSLFLGLLITLLFTKSRSGLLAFGLSSAAFWTTPLLFPPKLGGSQKGVLKNLGLFLVITATLTLLIKNPLRDLAFSKFLNTSPLAASPKPAGPALESGGTESGNIRKIVWTGALRIWRSSTKNFWVGTGPETFAISYFHHRPIEHNSTSEWEFLYNKAHNEFLNFLANTGLLGLLSYLVLLGFMAKNFQFSVFSFQINSDSQISKNENCLAPENWRLKIGLLSGWLSLSVTNFWGFSVVPTQLLLFLLPAVAVTLEPESIRAGESQSNLSKPQLFAYLTCIFAFGYLLFALVRYLVADINLAAGQKYLRSFTATQDPQYLLPAYTALSSAFRLNPPLGLIPSELALAAAYASLAIEDASVSAQFAALADAASAYSISTSPQNPVFYKSRARTLLILGATDPKYLALAAAALARAALLSPTDPRIPHIQALVAKQQADYAAAAAYIQQALDLKPDFADAVSAKITP